jgi:hypothetical protein
VCGYFGPALIWTLGVALIAAQLFNFSKMFGTAIEINTAFQFMWPLTFIVFFVASREGYREYIAKTLFVYATIYSVLFSILAVALFLKVLPSDISEPLAAEDVERGTRLFGYLIAVTFAWFGWLFRVRKSPTVIGILFLATCAIAMVLSQSRVITILAASLTILALLRVSATSIRISSLTIVWSAAAISIYGLIDQSWNPYSIFSLDSSGKFRMWEYELARDLISKNFFSGVGFAPTQWHLWNFLNYNYFSANDLGIFGVWVDWGLIGLVIFLIAGHISCASVRGMPELLRVPLFQVGCLMAAYGCIAPIIIYPGGATYFAVLFGYWLDSYEDSMISGKT